MTGWIARLLLSVAVLCFNGPRLISPAEPTYGAAIEKIDTQQGAGDKKEFHATVSVGHGEKQVTVQLEFGRERERGEDEAL